jgi:hypothetical protein
MCEIKAHVKHQSILGPQNHWLSLSPPNGCAKLPFMTPGFYTKSLKSTELNINHHFSPPWPTINSEHSFFCASLSGLIWNHWLPSWVATTLTLLWSSKHTVLCWDASPWHFLCPPLRNSNLANLHMAASLMWLYIADIYVSSWRLSLDHSTVSSPPIISTPTSCFNFSVSFTSVWISSIYCFVNSSPQ